MKVKTRAVLEECIEIGTRLGYNRAHKHTDEPSNELVFSSIENAIWSEIDQRFEFDVQKTAENE